jgi:hypothetical protein
MWWRKPIRTMALCMLSLCSACHPQYCASGVSLKSFLNLQKLWRNFKIKHRKKRVLWVVVVVVDLLLHQHHRHASLKIIIVLISFSGTCVTNTFTKGLPCAMSIKHFCDYFLMKF